ncbi:MAG: M48 family metallopeptidase [Dehalococcoidia bacterium]
MQSHRPVPPDFPGTAVPTSAVPDESSPASDPVTQAAPHYGAESGAGGLGFDPHTPRTGSPVERSFPGIDARVIRDPRDAGRMARVRVMKGLDFVYSRFLNAGVEESMRLELLAQAVQLGPRQAPSLWALLDRAARVLDIRLPDLFLAHHPAGIETNGHERPFIVIDPGLADLLTDDELVFAFGHILSGHVTYKMLARSIGTIGGMVGNFTLNLGSMVTTGLEAPLRDWDQFSEFSADRAGLLAVQRLDVAQSALFKEAAGGQRFFDEMRVDAFIEQGRQALWQERNVGTRLSAIVRSLQAGTPLRAARAAALGDWHAGGEYAAVMLGSYQQRG